MLTARRLRVRQAEAEAGGQPAPSAITRPTEFTRREHEAALWELKNRHAEELEQLRSATTAGDTAEIDRLKSDLAELEKQNNELQAKLETLAKQEQRLEAPGASTTPTDTKPGAAPFGVTNEGAPLGEQTQAPAAAPLDNNGDDKLEPGKPPAIPEPPAPAAAPGAPVAPTAGRTEVLPNAANKAKPDNKGDGKKK